MNIGERLDNLLDRQLNKYLDTVPIPPEDDNFVDRVDKMLAEIEKEND